MHKVLGQDFEETEVEGGGWRRRYSNGAEFWENEDRQYHREDGPAIIDPNTGREYYYLDGEQFRTKESWKEGMWKRNIKKIIGE